MRVEVLTRWKSLGVHELPHLPHREGEVIVLPTGIYRFENLGINVMTGMTEIYVSDWPFCYESEDGGWYCAEGVERVSPIINKEGE